MMIWDNQEQHVHAVRRRQTHAARALRRRERIGLLLIAICSIVAVIVLVVMLTGCASAQTLCDQLHAGAGLIQTSDNPITFNVVVQREVVMTGVTMDDISKCGVQR